MMNTPQHTATRRIRIVTTIITMLTLSATACSDRNNNLTLSEQAARGQTLYQNSGCAGCHGGDGNGGAGPQLTGIRNTERPLIDGTTVTADQNYLIRSIMEPHAELVDGYTIRMPANSLTQEQTIDIIAFIDELSQQSSS